MSIELHCPHCAKPIRAPDDAGGRHGKCPYCQQSVYIPLPPSPEDEIRVAPFDESDARREEELVAESIRYASAIDKDPTMQSESGAPRGERGGAASGRERGDAAGGFVDVPDEVQKFVLSMHTSKLDEAERVVARLKRAGSRARDYVDGLYLDQIPPQIGNVPPPLAKAFLKTLLDRLD
jgi:hypothetical protein